LTPHNATYVVLKDKSINRILQKIKCARLLKMEARLRPKALDVDGDTAHEG
jgi:hypothetical protein